MLLLSLESSTQRGSVGLNGPNGLSVEKVSMDPKRHSEFFQKSIEEILKEHSLSSKDITHIIVDEGPGSFTGLRVGINIAKTLGYVLDKPIFTQTSLFVLQHQTFRQPVLQSHIQHKTSKKVLTMINAFKNMVFVALYDQQGQALWPVQLKTNEDLVQDLLRLNESVYFVGDGFQAYESFWVQKLGSLVLREKYFLDHPTALTLGELTSENLSQNASQKNLQKKEWKSLLPLYLKASEAELNLKK